MKKAAQILLVGIGATILLSIKAFSQSGQLKKDAIIDTSSFAIMPYDTSSRFGFDSGIRTILSTQELLLLDSLVNACIKEFNEQGDSLFRAAQKKYPNEQIDRQEYFLDSVNVHEYVPIIDANGEKHVWVICLPADYKDEIRKHFIIVQDGGNKFFNLKVNLTKKRFYDLFINGKA